MKVGGEYFIVESWNWWEELGKDLNIFLDWFQKFGLSDVDFKDTLIVQIKLQKKAAITGLYDITQRELVFVQHPSDVRSTQVAMIQSRFSHTERKFACLLCLHHSAPLNAQIYI